MCLGSSFPGKIRCTVTRKRKSQRTVWKAYMELLMRYIAAEAQCLVFIIACRYHYKIPLHSPYA